MMILMSIKAVDRKQIAQKRFDDQYCYRVLCFKKGSESCCNTVEERI